VGGNVNTSPIDLTIVGQVVTRFCDDLGDLGEESFLTFKKDEVRNWFNYMIHKGIAAGIATCYDRTDFELTYSYEEALNGKHPSYAISSMAIDKEYSFNLRYNLLRMSMSFENYFNDIYDYIEGDINNIHSEGVSNDKILKTFLMYGCLTETEFIARTALTTHDYWPIRDQLILDDDLYENDEDIREIETCDLRPEFDEPLIDEENLYSVTCPFCGEEALVLSK